MIQYAQPPTVIHAVKGTAYYLSHLPAQDALQSDIWQILRRRALKRPLVTQHPTLIEACSWARIDCGDLLSPPASQLVSEQIQHAIGIANAAAAKDRV